MARLWLMLCKDQAVAFGLPLNLLTLRHMIRSKRATIGFAFLSLLVIELVVCVQYRGPAVVSERDAAEFAAGGVQVFSAEAALKIHQQLFDGTPHPTGSAENDAVRLRLVRLLQEHGWTVEVPLQRLDGIEGAPPHPLQNVVAWRPEQSGLNTQPLVLATHYDSCRFGPGAGDAGGCVAAVVEAGRLLTLKARELKRPVWLLFTDGEEAGLLGAKEFVRSRPLSQQRPLVLNFDARGSSGPVVMYETHAGNSMAVDEWVNTIARPRVTGSLFTAVYRTMPNGTDFSVFQQAGWQGFNFAIIDGAHRYHQPDDTLINLDPRSVQHFGEHALTLSTQIANNPIDLAVTSENSVFFDLLGLYVIHFPVWWCLPFRFGLLAIAVQLYGRQALRFAALQQSLRVWLTMLLIMVAAPVAGWMVSASLSGTIILPRPFVWYGHWLSVAMWCMSLLLSLSIAHWMLRRIDQRSVWDALWQGQAATCLVVSTWAPEFSHLLSIPAIMAIAVTLAVRSVALRTLFVTAGAGIIVIPVQHLLSIALGPAAGLVLFPTYALIAMPMLAAMGRLDSPLPGP